MNKSLIYLLLFSAILFSSCFNSPNSKLSYTDENTIKQIVKEKEESALWTEEIEKDRLNNKNSFSDKVVSKSVNVDYELLKVLDYQEKVFPEISDFGSLDITNLTDDTRGKINLFCEQISKDINNVDKDFFVSKYYFSFILFKNDLENGWKVHFNEDFPKEITDENNIFKKWYLGEPFISDGVIQLPIRFFAEKGYVDINLFLSEIEDLKIYQINLIKWGK